MKWYLISYDVKLGSDYSGLLGFMKRWNATRVLESLWIAAHTADAITVRDTLRNVVPPVNGLVVVEIKNDADWAIGHAHNGAVEAMKTASPPV
ncbi:hypothetical protein PCC82_11330 [Agrobacterium deltaense]